ncbi:hypothetical protein O7627_09915 [Solwaraspora sp. WMMD1047]|uniref:hypothetical protein n=1 Tax=Solwaraspora sp. WMMD1047 TaxID=3016102 RepID=UPI0024172325|nr:hypothetical protein [Solwaraspora sp. WMMD1047]MDG4829617.1 hypothetical protein [Solwaraspora sp. WMMD1047]
MSSLRIRLAAGAAALIVAASVGASIPSPVLAAGPQLSMSYNMSGDVDNGGRQFGVYAYNWGDEPASDVTTTYDASGLRDVEISVPRWVDDCQLDGKIVTCHFPVLAAEQTSSFQAFELTSRQQSTPGPAGTVKGTIRGFGPDGAEYTGSGDLDVTIIASGPDLVAFAEDINSADDPVGGGDVRPVVAGIYNDGDTPTGDWYVQIWVPTGGGIVEQYSDCEYRDWWPGEHPPGYVYGPSVVTCPAPADLDPLGVGEGLVFVDESGESLFHVAFGKNLRGPEETGGSVQVGLVDDLRAERAPQRLTRKGSSDKTFAEAVAGLAPTTRAASRREGNTENNWAEFAVWTKPNKHDFAVTAGPVSGNIGDIVEIPYTVINNGPSDGSAGWTFTAPTGTLFVDDGDHENGPWCYFNDEDGRPVEELPVVSCSTEGEFPAKASGYQGVQEKIKLRIVSTPGDDGTLRVRPYGENAESNPANDEVKLVVTVGGSGGGLPITGVNAALVGAVGGGVVAVGAALFLLARRRRIVIVSE